MSRGRWLFAAAAMLVLCGAGLVAWARHPSPEELLRARALQRSAHVILITLDGPLRDDVLSGPDMRGLQAAVQERGVAFEALAASPVTLSLPGYQAIAAGALTPCGNNDCPRIAVETVGEALARRLALPPEQVAVFASWSRLARAASSRDGAVWVDAPQDSPAHAGGPPWRNGRYDEETFARARAHWEAHHPRFLHLAFLDTDEYAHRDERSDYARALRETDARVLEVLRWVEALPDAERAATTVLLTSDHGRGAGPKWTEHYPGEPGSADIFIAAIGPLVARKAPAHADQRALKPTIERLFGLCPQRDEGAPLAQLLRGLPCE